MSERAIDTYKPGSKHYVFLTGGLPYPTGPIHLGTIASTFVAAQSERTYLDMRKKFIDDVAQDGRELDSVFISGADVNGIGAAHTALARGYTPDRFSKVATEEIKKTLEEAGIIPDYFGSSRNKTNQELVERVFEALVNQKFIEYHNVEEVYCPKCEFTIPGRKIYPKEEKNGNQDNGSDSQKDYDPEKIKDSYCVHCGEETKGKLEIIVGKDHPHLNMEKIAPYVAQFIDEVIADEDVKKRVKKKLYDEWLDNPEKLPIWDLARTNGWGFDIPGTDGKLQFYVWFDAPLQYLAGLMEHFKEKGEPEGWRKFAQGEYAIMNNHIGKDIDFHHMVYFPGFLIAYNMDVPESERFNLAKMIEVRGHMVVYKRDKDGKIVHEILVNGKEGKRLTEKMSKSWDNAPYVRDLLKKYHPDMLKAYLTGLSSRGLVDIIYDEDDIFEKGERPFANKISNLVYRTLDYIRKHKNNIISSFSLDNDSKIGYDIADCKLIESNKNIFKKVGDLIEKGHHRAAFEEIYEFAGTVNKYIQDHKPWEKKGVEQDKLLNLVTNSIKNLSILLRPYTPNMSEKIKEMLNVDYEWMWRDEGKMDLETGRELGEVYMLMDIREKQKKKEGTNKKRRNRRRKRRKRKKNKS